MGDGLPEALVAAAVGEIDSSPQEIKVADVTEEVSPAKAPGKKKWQPRSPEERQAAQDAAQEMLMQAVEQMQKDPVAAKKALASISHFRNRSLSNVYLLLFQKSDVTRVAGYKEWQKLGYQVKKVNRV